MPPPFKAEFMMQGRRVTSLVLDESEFTEFVQSCSDVLNPKQAKALIEAKHIPIMSRGQKTEHAFAKYGIKTDFLSVIVRGAGQDLAEKLGISPSVFRQILESTDPTP